jgi:short-subunit dehydrogenase
MAAGHDAAMSLPPPDPDATVLITGASSGIGAELARLLAERGHNVTLVARRRPQLTELAEELTGRHGVSADVHAVDLGDAAERRKLLSAVRTAGRHVAGLCNNAGFGSFGWFSQLDQERERQEVRVNVVALHELTGEFLPAMIERGAGAILNVGSIAGAQPLPGNATYAATKAFVNSLSEALHAELHGSGVSCTLLTPGPVKTEFSERAGVADIEASSPGFAWETPQDVARAAVEGMEKGRRVVVPGLPAKLTSAGGRFAPRTLLLPAAKMVMSRRY